MNEASDKPTQDFARTNFKFHSKINIIEKRDIDPVEVKVCGHEWNKVIVFELQLGTQLQLLKVALASIPKCPKSDSGRKCEPFLLLILFSLFLFVIT